MAEKHVLVTFNHAPHGSIYYAEGLRAALGVTAGIDEHTVDILCLGDGVYFALKEADRGTAPGYLERLQSLGSHIKVEQESLAARDILEEELAEDVEIVSRGEVLALLEKADATIDF